MARIFIAYDHEHQLFATRLARSLSNVGAEVWIDIEDIPLGAKWHNAIQQGLDTCEIMLLVITPQSMKSENVEEEWRFFKDVKKPIIPILLERAEVNYQLRSLQYIDFENQEFRPAFAQLHSELRRKGLTLQPISSADDSVAIPAQKPLPVQGRRRINWNSPFLIALVIPLFVVVVGALIQTWPDILKLLSGSNTSTQIASGNPTETSPATVDNSANTPDLNATVAARQTLNADATATAASPTPSVTSPPTATPTPTDDIEATIAAMIVATDRYNLTLAATTALESALQRASTFSGGNRDWQPFAYVFPDDPSGAEMVIVPVGTFMMGSANGESDEQPVHPQSFTQPFWIDRLEVTRGQYQVCVTAGACTETPASDFSTRDSQPINRVTWFQARDYCAWRGAQLPTEAQWEYAARGPQNWVYPWEGEWNPENTVWSENSGNQTADVGSRPAGASWVGALDLSGNVWEWVSSLYADYPYDSSRESNSDDNSPRVLRGGSFNVSTTNLSAADRFRNDPSFGSFNIGMRCARLS